LARPRKRCDRKVSMDERRAVSSWARWSIVRQGLGQFRDRALRAPTVVSL
jgi:hypothetical protein